MTLRWLPTRSLPTFSLAEFDVGTTPLSPEQLASIALPAEVFGREQFGLIFSGRGPVWLYAHLCHLAHPFAWVAVHDPRLGGGVVVQRHVSDAPQLGSVVPI